MANFPLRREQKRNRISFLAEGADVLRQGSMSPSFDPAASGQGHKIDSIRLASRWTGMGGSVGGLFAACCLAIFLVRLLRHVWLHVGLLRIPYDPHRGTPAPCKAFYAISGGSHGAFRLNMNETYSAKRFDRSVVLTQTLPASFPAPYVVGGGLSRSDVVWTLIVIRQVGLRLGRFA